MHIMKSLHKNLTVHSSDTCAGVTQTHQYFSVERGWHVSVVTGVCIHRPIHRVQDVCVPCKQPHFCLFVLTAPTSRANCDLVDFVGSCFTAGFGVCWGTVVLPSSYT